VADPSNLKYFIILQLFYNIFTNCQIFYNSTPDTKKDLSVGEIISSP